MNHKATKIDSRSAEQIVSSVKEKIGLSDSREDPLGEALVQIFGRYCEIIIERLNKVPDKNYRAFLNELGVSRRPPIAARVPLTFTPVKSNGATAIVIPQYTKVTAPPAEGEQSPIVFETTHALTLTYAELDKIIFFESEEDLYTDHSPSISQENEKYEELLFKGNSPVKHEFFLGFKEDVAAHLSTIHLFISIEKPIANLIEPMLEWKIKAGEEEQIIKPEKDTTEALCRSGEVVFSNLPQLKTSEISGLLRCWISCRLINKVNSTDTETQQKPSIIWPKITSIDIEGDAVVECASLEDASFNGFSLDLSKDFFPLGERPRFGDVFYLNCKRFAEPGFTITLNINLTNAASKEKDPPIRRVNQNGEAVIQWEYWNGEQWDLLECTDETQALTEDGRVIFQLPEKIYQTSVNGLDGNWIRARLISGHYGTDERFDYAGHEDEQQGFKFLAATLAPPAIQSIAVRSHKKLVQSKPDVVLTHNNFCYEKINVSNIISFSPFNVGHVNALYFGYKAANREILAEKEIDMYFQVEQSNESSFYRGEQKLPAFTWQCWNGVVWKDCIVLDKTNSFTQSGIVSLSITKDISTWNETSFSSESQLFWVRAIWNKVQHQISPTLQRVLLNTVQAVQSLTLENEIIGSGNGTPNQVFYSSRTPIVGDLILEVKEPQRPSESELKKLIEEEGEHAVTSIKNADDYNEGFWICWHQVNDFLESGKCDRHFVIEDLSGEIHFGDGDKGMQAPSGANNIRLRTYKTGGGLLGNIPINSATQLRSSLPFVDSVTNVECASGGQDIEGLSSLYTRGSRYLRHRSRAVTPEDYEDLAVMASAQIARAKCYPLQDLTSSLESKSKPGVVSLVIVPNSTQPDPKPGLELLRSTWKFINKANEQGVSLIVLGPEYVRINIDVILVPAHDYLGVNIISDVQKCLLKYLHPLNGGENSEGWDFGVRPHHSDIYALLESVPGMENVQSLKISSEEERAGLEKSGVYLICSGELKIQVGQQK